MASEKDMDFEIIWKKLHSSLTPEEEIAFDLWLKEDPTHGAYFQQAQRGLGNQHKEAIIKPMAWERLKPIPKRRGKKFFYTAGIIAVVVLTGVLAWPPPERQAQALVKRPAIVPGSDKAILINSTGESIELSPGNVFNTEELNTKVKPDGTSIVYTESSGGEYQEANKENLINTLIIPRGGEFSLVLSDGTKVWINSDSRLEYPISFSGNTREVRLQGEAFFEVAHDEKKEFKIISEEQVVSVLGTKFNVTSYQEHNEVLTTLVEGKVKVTSNVTGIGKTITPGIQISLNKETNTLSSKEVDVDLFVSWKEGWFVFEDQGLGEILETLSRWYAVDVFFINPEAKSLKFTGDVQRHENIQKILTLIEKTNAVKIEIKDRTIIVR